MSFAWLQCKRTTSRTFIIEPTLSGSCVNGADVEPAAYQSTSSVAPVKRTTSRRRITQPTSSVAPVKRTLSRPRVTQPTSSVAGPQVGPADKESAEPPYHLYLRKTSPGLQVPHTHSSLITASTWSTRSPCRIQVN